MVDVGEEDGQLALAHELVQLERRYVGLHYFVDCRHELVGDEGLEDFLQHVLRECFALSDLFVGGSLVLRLLCRIGRACIAVDVRELAQLHELPLFFDTPLTRAARQAHALLEAVAELGIAFVSLLEDAISS